MSLGNNIRSYRESMNMTQLALSNELNVTPQAVSRWETNQVEPSIDTLLLMAKIFNVSIDKLISKNQSDENIVAESFVESPVVTVPEIVVENKEPLKPKALTAAQITRNRLIEKNRVARLNGFVFGAIVALVLLVVLIILLANGIIDLSAPNIILTVILVYATFAFVFSLLAKNNFVGEKFWDIVLFGFVKMPGLIFELSLDGIIWLITVKLVLAIISFIISTFFAILALAISLFLSMFVFPYALYSSLHHPERYEEV